MIKLHINQKDIDNLNRQLQMKIDGLHELTQNKVIEQVAHAAFVVLGERFMLATDRYAAMNYKKMHHIYEWKQVGKPTARLFRLERSHLMGGTVIYSKFLNSKTPVPVPSELSYPGKNGRYVRSGNIFRDKANVMESGRAVSFRAKKMLAFMGDSEVRFIRPGTRVNIAHPGGREVKNSFSRFMYEWYNKNAQTIMDSSGLYEKIVNEASMILNKNNAGSADVRKAVNQIVNSITHGVEVIR
jgi:hypothetical protein